MVLAKTICAMVPGSVEAVKEVITAACGKGMSSLASAGGGQLVPSLCWRVGVRGRRFWHAGALHELPKGPSHPVPLPRCGEGINCGRGARGSGGLFAVGRGKCGAGIGTRFPGGRCPELGGGRGSMRENVNPIPGSICKGSYRFAPFAPCPLAGEGWGEGDRVGLTEPARRRSAAAALRRRCGPRCGRRGR